MKNGEELVLIIFGVIGFMFLTIGLPDILIKYAIWKKQKGPQDDNE